ncbi:MAG: methyltransferase [Acetobacteraceae bacterium]|nr:methyltransferase [Acetobacteraceae bacterium]
MTGGCAPATTIGALLCEGGEVLRAAGVEEARRESRLLLALALGRDAAGLLAAARDPVAEPRTPHASAPSLRRRAAREPFAHIAGRRGFWTLELAVSPAVLVPRPETETLVEAALALRPDRAAVRRIVDLGTGSGALLLAALAEYPEAIGLGVDRSAAALDIARRNAAAAGLAARALFAARRLVVCARPRLGRSPPLQPALCPDRGDRLASRLRCATTSLAPLSMEGRRGFPPIAPCCPTFRGCSRQGGVAIVEVGIGQADAVAALGVAAGLALLEMRQDLGGIPRAIAFGNAEKGVGVGALSD